MKTLPSHTVKAEGRCLQTPLLSPEVDTIKKDKGFPTKKQFKTRGTGLSIKVFLFFLPNVLFCFVSMCCLSAVV